MSYAQRMLETSPSGAPLDAAALAECIEVCFDCAQVCTACADACLGEEDIQMRVLCIRVCAEACRRCESASNNVLSAIAA